MKVKPRKAGRFRRRATTIAIYALGFGLLTMTWPLWLSLGLLVGVVRRRRFIVLRLLAFGWFYLGVELLALTLVGGVFMRRRGNERDESLYALQAWWASINLAVASWMLRLQLEVEGTSEATPGPSASPS